MVDGRAHHRELGTEAALDRVLDAGGIEPQQRQQLARVAVIGEVVGQAELQHRPLDAGLGQALEDGGTCSAHDHALLHGDQCVVRTRQFEHQLGV